MKRRKTPEAHIAFLYMYIPPSSPLLIGEGYRHLPKLFSVIEREGELFTFLKGGSIYVCHMLPRTQTACCVCMEGKAVSGSSEGWRERGERGEAISVSHYLFLLKKRRKEASFFCSLSVSHPVVSKPIQRKLMRRENV